MDVTKEDCVREVVKVTDTRVEVQYSLFTLGLGIPPTINETLQQLSEKRVLPWFTERWSSSELSSRRERAEEERTLLEPDNWAAERSLRLGLLVLEDEVLDEIEAAMNEPLT